MYDIKTLCAEYGNTDLGKKEVLLNKIASCFYTDPRIDRIINAAIHKNKLNHFRAEDLRQDVALVFTNQIINKLQDPEAVLGLIKGIAHNCALRLGQVRYDNELVSNEFISDDDNFLQIPNNDLSSSELEGNRLSKIMKEQAQIKISKALRNPNLGSKTNEAWVQFGISTLPVEHVQSKVFESLESQPITKQPKKKKSRYEANKSNVIPDTDQIWFQDVLMGTTKLSCAVLGELLGINKHSLAAYQSLRNKIPKDTMAQMVSWYNIYGKAIAKWQAEIENMPMNDIVDNWIGRLNFSNDHELSEFLGVTYPTVWRWRQETSLGQSKTESVNHSRPSPSRMYVLESKVGAWFYNNQKAKWLSENKTKAMRYIATAWMQTLKISTAKELSDFFGSHNVSQELAEQWLEGGDNPKYRPTNDKLFEFNNMVEVAASNRKNIIN